MDIQLQELIDKIKKDGIEQSSADAQRIKAEAQAEAHSIIAAAKKEAEDFTAKAKSDAERFEKAGIAALEQASRNLVLEFKAEITTLLGGIIQKETAAVYSDDMLKVIIPEVVKGWAAKGDAVEVLLSNTQLAGLEAFFNEKLLATFKGGVTLKGDKNLGSGFKIAYKDGSAYYDFSAEAVADLLSAYLNPRLATIMSSSVKGA